MPDYLGICMELTGMRLSQYRNYNFNSMCKFGDAYLGANDLGIFVLDSGQTDAGTAIEAFFEIVTSDFGAVNQKRFRSMYIGYEANGELVLTVKDDENNERAYTLEPIFADSSQHGQKVAIGRDGKGRYWMVRIDNVGGADFSVDRITAIPVLLGRKPPGA
ncbi:MAG: hypothetical protein ACYSW3_00195 [Planctomycetota bacterium]|jgi:hypothetical protein